MDYLHRWLSKAVSGAVLVGCVCYLLIEWAVEMLASSWQVWVSIACLVYILRWEYIL